MYVSRERRQVWNKSVSLFPHVTLDASLPAFSSEEPRSLRAGPARRRCSPDWDFTAVASTGFLTNGH